MIDTKRLATDAAYWDEVAPDDATHYVPKEYGRDADVFWRIEGEIGYEAWVVTNGGLVHYRRPTWTEDSFTRAIPRPQSPEAEWVDGLPKMAIMVNPHEAPLQYGEEHLGREVEVIEWLPDESCYVVRFDWGLGVLHDSMIDFGLHKVRTKEQRERKELAALCKRVFMQQTSSTNPYTFDKIADAIIADGWSKEHGK